MIQVIWITSGTNTLNYIAWVLLTSREPKSVDKKGILSTRACSGARLQISVVTLLHWYQNKNTIVTSFSWLYHDEEPRKYSLWFPSNTHPQSKYSQCSVSMNLPTDMETVAMEKPYAPLRILKPYWFALKLINGRTGVVPCIHGSTDNGNCGCGICGYGGLSGHIFILKKTTFSQHIPIHYVQLGLLQGKCAQDYSLKSSIQIKKQCSLTGALFLHSILCLEQWFPTFT